MADFDSTANYDLPFPTGSANPDIPRDFKNLAEKVDEELGVLALNVPVGCIMMYWGTAAPSGWLMCDGKTVVDPSKYPELHAMVGNTTPAMQAKQPVGYDGGNAAYNGLGKSGGTTHHTMTEANSYQNDNRTPSRRSSKFYDESRVARYAETFTGNPGAWADYPILWSPYSGASPDMPVRLDASPGNHPDGAWHPTDSIDHRDPFITVGFIIKHD